MTPEVEAMIRAAHGKCSPDGCYRRLLLDELDDTRVERDSYLLAIRQFLRAKSGTAIAKTLARLKELGR